MNRHVAEILRECPGCEVDVIAEIPARNLLVVVYVPPPQDLARARSGTDDDWGRICRPTLMCLPLDLPDHAVN